MSIYQVLASQRVTKLAIYRTESAINERFQLVSIATLTGAALHAFVGYHSTMENFVSLEF